MKIGVTLPQSESESGPAPRYSDIRAAALQAEQGGFDSVWIMDHLLFQFDGNPIIGVWEGLSVLAALAEATERVELGALVLCTAFRNPALLAKMADAIDEISGGRLILGLGAGWHEPEFSAFGYPFDHLASRFEEAVAIIAPLVRTGEVNFEGAFERAPNCLNSPRGPRPGGPPILMGVQGPRLLKLAAREADAWNACWLRRADELPEKIAPMLAACAENGRKPESLELTVGQEVSFLHHHESNRAENAPAHSVFSDSRDLAEEWRRFSEAGVRHMIVAPEPDSPETRDLVLAAMRIYREGSPG